MRLRSLPWILGIAGFVAGAFLLLGQGGQKRFRAVLTGYGEVPVVSTPATGEFHAVVSGGDSSLSYELTYSNLQGGSPLFAHVHVGQNGVNGGIAFFLCGGGGKPACPGPTSGSVSGTVVPADVIGPNGQGISAGEFAEVVHAMRSGVAYANVHTPSHMSGEIRAQISDAASEK